MIEYITEDINEQIALDLSTLGNKSNRNDFFPLTVEVIFNIKY